METPKGGLMSLIIVGKNENGEIQRITTPECDEVLTILSERASKMRRGIIKGKGENVIWHLYSFLMNPNNDATDSIINAIGIIVGEDFHDLVRTTVSGNGNC